ncbi:hypothetical protein CHCC14821_0935 [Bacillus paralicheniformis]|nr:hypothetical protein CHCC14821_0935 [Bacillus paralicheniformis]
MKLKISFGLFLLQFLLIRMKQARTMLACFKGVRVSLEHRMIGA